MAITSREGVGDDGILRTNEETTIFPFSSCSFRLFKFTASWDNGSFFIPLIQAQFSLLYLVSNQRKEEYNTRNHTRIYKVVKILYLLGKG